VFGGGARHELFRAMIDSMVLIEVGEGRALRMDKEGREPAVWRPFS